MSRFARLLVLTFALLATVPGVARAQYLTTVTEHDWTVVVAARRVGLEQYVIIPGDVRRTRIHWAFGTTSTEIPAPTIALVAGGIFAAFLAGLACLIGTRVSSSRGKKSRDD